jgi:hypothetical protein
MGGTVTDGWTMYEPPQHEEQARRLAGIIEGYTEDCRRFAKTAREAKLSELHTTFHLSWEEFCVTRLRNPPEVVDAIMIGVEVLGEEMPIRADVAVRIGQRIRQLHLSQTNTAHDAKQVRPKGRPAKDRGENVYNNKNVVNIYDEPLRGNSALSALRRLKKSRPDLHAKCLDGEMTAHAAMVEAGYRRKPPPRRKPILTRVQALWQQADTDERQRITQWLLSQMEVQA